MGWLQVTISSPFTISGRDGAGGRVAQKAIGHGVLGVAKWVGRLRGLGGGDKVGSGHFGLRRCERPHVIDKPERRVAAPDTSHFFKRDAVGRESSEEERIVSACT